MNRGTLYVVCVIVAALTGACTPYVPQELADARRVYGDVAHGPAMANAPAELHKAEVALAEAEKAWDQDPRGERTRDLSYIADRKARLADTIARGAVAQRNLENAQQDYNKTQSQIIGQQRETIGNQAQTITQSGAAVNEANRNVAAAEAAKAEADRRAENADQRAKEAETRLSKLAMVSEEPRGMVITLSGSVLFASNQAVLLPDAEKRLDQVAEALMATKERKIIVEGYTDARGSETYNLDLSRRRAEAVRAYLVSRGYEPDLISSEGMGKARPVANNTTAEGRANNRRVEIVVKNKGD